MTTPTKEQIKEAIERLSKKAYIAMPFDGSMSKSECKDIQILISALQAEMDRLYWLDIRN